MGCIADQNKLNNGDDHELVWYQWVFFMLVINACIFRIPHYIWKLYERGLMKAFYSQEAKEIFIQCREGEMNQLLRIKTEYFKKIKGHNQSYFCAFFLCQLLNLAMVLINFYINNDFLEDNFSTYGRDVLNYHMLEGNQADFQPNPMCNTFPTTVNCNLNFFGTSGESNTSGICILSQNIINQKIYLALWFWFVILIVLGSIQILSEICIILHSAFNKAQLDGLANGISFAKRSAIFSEGLQSGRLVHSLPDWQKCGQDFLC